MRVRSGMALWLSLLMVAGCGKAREPGREEITVYAAASLTDALGVLADSFEAAHPSYRVVLNVAATSILARQIEQGAPADVFFSANRAWMMRLAEGGWLREPVREPLGNRLVVVAHRDHPRLGSLAELAAEQRLALADPEHVPAGIYARQALECAGLWEQVQPNVIPMLDVRAAVLAVRNRAADAALVYASDVQADPNVQVVLAWPDACQPDIRYAVAALKNTAHPEGAARFIAFVTDPARATVWTRFGFLPR